MCFTLQVYYSNLAYSVDEYVGELYRMNLSCSGESGCLFFKVGGRTKVSNGE